MDEFIRMARALTCWKEKDVVVQVELTTQIDQPFVLGMNQGCMAYRREENIAFLKHEKLLEDSG